MKLLLDECIPQPLKKAFPTCVVETVASMGWAGKKDKELLVLASEIFDAFITVDQNLRYQQNLQHFNISIIVLSAKTNHVKDLLPLADKANKY